MKLHGWQFAAGVGVKVLGIVGVASAIAFVIPAAATINADSSGDSELFSKSVHRDTNSPVDAFPVNSLDYILGDTVFGSLMFASTSPAATGQTGPRRNANNSTIPTTLLS